MRVFVNIIILSIISQISNSKQVSEISDAKFEQEKLNLSQLKYSISTDTLFDIPLENPSAFAINVQVKDPVTGTFKDQNVSNNSKNVSEGCYGIQPQFNWNQIRKKRFDVKGQNIFYCDLQQIQINKQLYLVILTSDFHFNLVAQKSDSFEIVQNISFSDALGVQGIQERQALFRSNGEDHFIFTADGTLRVVINKDINNIDTFSFKFEIQESVFVNEGVLDAVIVGNLIFYARGEDSLHCYEIKQDKSLERTALLTSQDFQIKDEIKPNVIQVKYDEKNQYVYVLEGQTGLHIFALKDFPKTHLMQIEIQNGFHFDYYGTTFMVIGRAQNQDYLKEIYVDISKKEFTINKELTDEVTINGILMLKEIAIIASDDMQEISHHSVYKQQIPSDLDLMSQYDGENFKILQALQISDSTKSDSSFFVLKPYELIEYQIQIASPQMKCSSSKKQNQEYQITLYQRDCNNKKINQDSSMATSCQLQGQIQIEFYESSSDEGLNTLYIILISVGSLLLLLIIIYVGIKIVKQKRKFQQLMAERLIQQNNNTNNNQDNSINA